MLRGSIPLLATKMTDFVFPLIRRPTDLRPDPYAGQPNVYEPGVCIRAGCGHPRAHSTNGAETVLCEVHLDEVLRGDACAPPLRRHLDYQSSARRSLVLEYETMSKDKP